MPQQDMASVPHPVLLAPAAVRGRLVELPGERMIVGREPGSDLQLDNPHVSRRHAVLRRQGDAVFLEDLGSTGGTFVNESPAAGRPLRPGDVIRFASVEARFEAAAPASVTLAVPARAGTARPGDPDGQQAAGHYQIGYQQAGTVNNVARDQYQAYFQQVVHERDGFLREVTAAKTKARWLIRLGALLLVVGGVLFVLPGVAFEKQVDSQLSAGTAGPVSGPPLIAGIPMDMLGWMIFAAGIVTVGIGSRLHQVAVARRGQVDREHPLPPPWRPLP